MDKFLVLGVVLTLQLSGLLAEPYIVRSPEYGEIPPYFRLPQSQPNHDTISPATQDSFNNLAKSLNDLISAPARVTPTEVRSADPVVKQLSSEYLVTKGIGAHKLHLRKLSWNKARKVCIDEGGQLADIQSDSEEKIVLRMLVEDSVQFAWIGYHDIFEEGDWVSVLGEPLGKSGWDRWWKVKLPNPDNVGGEEDCAALMRDGGGMNDDNCSKELPFVCKITAL